MLAPWLSHIPDYLGAASRGASLGLDLRRTEDANNEASARLRLNYATLGQHQQESMARLAAGQQSQSYAAAERLREQDALERWRQTQARHQQATEIDAGRRLAMQDARLISQDANADASRALAVRHQDFLEKQASTSVGEKLFHAGNKYFKLKPDGSTELVFDANVDKLSQVDEVKLKALAHEKNSMIDEYNKAAASGLRVAPETVSRISHRNRILDAEIEKFRRPVAPVAAPSPAAGLTNAPAALPNASPKKRVRVKGPNGEKGTVEEGDTLPEGWKLE